MSLFVVKFGGVAMMNANSILAVARQIKEELNLGIKVVPVISAMHGETDRLVSIFKQISPNLKSDILPEYDVVMSSGECIAAGLLSAALINMGVNARSFTGWQTKILTEDGHRKSCIENITITDELQDALNNDIVPVITGFQGINKNKRITTLGRGGTDISAVAMAKKLNANACIFYKDVNGIYTADPKVCENAKLIKEMSLYDLLDLCACGARILHYRAIELALMEKVNLQIRSISNDLDRTTLFAHASEESSTCDRPVAISQNAEMLIEIKSNTMENLKLLSLLYDLASDVHAYIDIISCKESILLTSSLPDVDLIIDNLRIRNLVSDIQINILKRVGKVSIIGQYIEDNRAECLRRIYENLDVQNISNVISVGRRLSMIIKDIEKMEDITRILHNVFFCN